ncbi:MAG: RagB/SusD family nutrient uptake outer membrane protein [Chryseolinea sp.]
MITYRKYKIYTVLTLLVLGIVSCEPELEVEQRDTVSFDAIWSDPANADLFMNDLYQQMPRMNNDAKHLDQYADNSHVGAEWFDAKVVLYAGAISPTRVMNGPGARPYDPNTLPEGLWNWEGRYITIRKTNMFIQNVLASEKLKDDYKKGRVAEARFLRALSYQWLWLAYGGVPIITEVLDISAQGEEVFRARNTDEETFQFIVSELEAIANDLPLTRTGADRGRATKGAALTLKGWVELYAASPLRNTSNAVSKWQAAAATNKQVIDLGVYSLFQDFGGIWLPENNNNVEVIFDYQVSKTKNGGGNREGYFGPAFVNGVQQAWANYAPTQELVDDFAMDNGKTIDDPTSGYNPQNPYVGREKRFYQTILYDGSIWQGYPLIMRVGVGSPNEIDLGSKNDVTNTGYYARKTLDEKILGQDNISNTNGGQNYIWFRFAEVLLSYAEAQNQAEGPDASVYDAVNKVRSRSDLPGLPLGLSKEEMRKAIWRERRVEFAFEDKRWWDVLRWKIAHGPQGVLNNPTHGMYIESVGGVLTYKPVKVTDRVFPERMYLMPIPIAATNRNAKLEQNPGY